jgi:lysyl-tRNA synthetase class I
MSMLKRILNAVSGGSGTGGPKLYPIQVKCKRCGEILTATVNLANDLSVEYDSSGSPESYTCRKIVQGSGRCFQTIEIVLEFDSHRTLKEKEITGGTFVEE